MVGETLARRAIIEMVFKGDAETVRLFNDGRPQIFVAWDNKMSLAFGQGLEGAKLMGQQVRLSPSHSELTTECASEGIQAFLNDLARTDPRQLMSVKICVCRFTRLHTLSRPIRPYSPSD